MEPQGVLSVISALGVVGVSCARYANWRSRVVERQRRAAAASAAPQPAPPPLPIAMPTPAPTRAPAPFNGARPPRAQRPPYGVAQAASPLQEAERDAYRIATATIARLRRDRAAGRLGEEEFQRLVGVELARLDQVRTSSASDRIPKHISRELLARAAELVVSTQCGLEGVLCRKLDVSAGAARELMDVLGRIGVVGPSRGSKARQVLVRPVGLERLLAEIRSES